MQAADVMVRDVVAVPIPLVIRAKPVRKASHADPSQFARCGRTLQPTPPTDLYDVPGEGRTSLRTNGC
jgi:hypothetical protein